jgi:hypothetical protein
VAFAFVALIGGIWSFEIHGIEDSEISQESLGALPGGDQARIIFGNTTLSAGVADESDERILGLSGREGLGEREGLLFIFDEPGRHGIWMKDMLFPIDIIWLDENFQVVGLAENVTPDTFPTSFNPQGDAIYVLEVNAGLAERSGVGLGDEIIIEGL